MANIISKNIGIDLGTSSVLVYVSGKGIVMREPSVIAVDRMGKTVAFGDDARGMIGRTPENITVIKPVKYGIVSDYSLTERMLRHCIKKAGGGFGKPNIVVCVPCLASDVEKKAVTEAALSAGAKRVKLIKEPVAAAIGAGMDINKPNGKMVIDIGGGSCDIAVISLGGIVINTTVSAAGDSFDNAIVRYIRKKYNIVIGERTAEDIKMSVGAADNSRDDMTEAFGLSLISGLPQKFVVSSSDVREAVHPCIEKIIDTVKNILETTPPELVSDIKKSGILMSGGGSLLNGIDSLIEDATGITSYIAKDAVLCVARGVGMAAAKSI